MRMKTAGSENGGAHTAGGKYMTEKSVSCVEPRSTAEKRFVEGKKVRGK